MLIEIGEVDHEVLEDIHVRQGTDLDSRSGGGGGMKGKEGSETSETVLSIDVHSTRTADSFTTGSTKGERWIVALDGHESIQHHFPSLLVRINDVSFHSKSAVSDGVVSVHIHKDVLMT